MRINFTLAPSLQGNSNAFATVALQVFTPSGWVDMATVTIRAFVLPTPIAVHIYDAILRTAEVN